MRRNLILGGAAALVALPTIAPAQAGAEAVMAANAAFDAALSRRDIDALDGMWLHAPHVVAIHPAGRTPLVGWDAVRRSWVETCERFSELSVTLADPKAHIAGDTAWVVGIEAVRGKRKDGADVSFPALTTNVYERHGGKWLMVLHHASRVPQ